MGSRQQPTYHFLRLMKDFTDVIKKHNWQEVSSSIYGKTAQDVQIALSKPKRSLEDFQALISPAAEPFLEYMAQLSHQLTQRRFGKTVQLYVPLYVSNECQNICTYCGFSLDVKIKRKTLSEQELMEEVRAIKSLGFDHVLLVSGEANNTVGTEYFKNALRLVKPYFSNVGMEVQPLDKEDYSTLIDEGLNAVLVYQETYSKDHYKSYHPKGKKSNYEYRLATPDRLGQAGIHKIGLGALIGLEDWRVDSFFTALHLDYLEKTYWRTKYSVSFPRLRPCASGFPLKSVITDRQLAQLICAYRIFNEEVELSMSTRESEAFRDNIIKLGITSISAESKTNPGGYAIEKGSLEQFEIEDKRPVADFIKIIREKGYEAVFKDWDNALNS